MIHNFLIPFAVILLVKTILYFLSKGSLLDRYNYPLLDNNIEVIKNDRKDLIRNFQVGMTLLMSYLMLLAFIQLFFLGAE
jgi:hypothetical protein